MPSRDLVRDDEVLLDPVDRGGLVAPAALIVRARFPLVALLDRGVVVQGGRGALALGGHLVHAGGVDAGQSLQRRILGRDVGHLAGGPLGLGRGDQLVVMKRVEEVPKPIGGRGPPAEAAAEPAIGLEHRDVLEAVPAGGEPEDQGLDLLGLGVAALPLAEVDVLPDRPGQSQRAQRLEDEGQAGPAGQSVPVRDRLHRVRQEALAHRGAGCAAGCRARGGALCRSARFTAVSSLTIVQSSW